MFGANTLLTKGLVGSYTAGLMQSEASIASEISTVVQSTSLTETHAGLADVPQLTEWRKHGRTITDLAEKSYALTNVRYQAAFAVDRDDFDDDQLRQYATRATQLGTRAANHPTSLAIAALAAGATAGNTSYDGVTFFNDTHPIRGDMTATWDNNIAGGGTTVAQLQADLQTARAAMRRFRDEANEPANENMSRLLIIAPPELEDNFLTALRAPLTGGGNTNITQGLADLYITSRLTDTNDWFMLNLSHPIKPFVWQQRKPLTPESVTSGSDVFHTANYLWGVWTRYAIGYLMPLYAVRITNV